MSLRPEPIGPVPEETARVARAAFPRGNSWLRLRDELAPATRTRRSRRCFPRTADRRRRPGAWRW
jgi:transposase